MATGGIGDYIHYRKIMYRQFGIGVREPGISASAALSEQRKKLQINTGAALPSNFKIELEKTLTSLMYPKNKKTQYDKVIDKQEQEKIRQEMERLAQVYDGKISSTWENGGNISGSSTNKVKKLSQNNIKYMKASTIYKKIQEFFKVLKRQVKGNILSQEKAIQLNNEMTMIKEIFKRELSTFSTNTKLIIRKDSDLWEYIEKINELIAELKYPKIELLNTMWEDAVEKVAGAVSKWADNQAETLVTTTITKATRTQNLIMDNPFGKYVNLSAVSATYNLSENTKGELVMDLGEDECKASLNLEFLDNGQTKTIGLSAQNPIGDDINIDKEMLLMDVLLDSSSSFATHILNMMTQNETGGYSILDVKYQKELKRICAVKALQGIINSKGYSADYIILNNRKGKNVVLKSINEIMNKVNGDVDKYFTFDPNIGNIRLANKFVETTSGNNMLAARERIANVLIEARAVKISASIKKSALY